MEANTLQSLLKKFNLCTLYLLYQHFLILGDKKEVLRFIKIIEVKTGETYFAAH